MLIPETFNGEKLGLVKQFEREYSPSPPQSGRGSREGSPWRVVGFADQVREGSRSPWRVVEQVRESSRSPVGNMSGGYKVKIGDRVIVRSSVGESKPGVLRFVGGVDFAEGSWAGVELFHPLGKNDGTLRGRW
jgi:hypothetical protein